MKGLSLLFPLLLAILACDFNVTTMSPTTPTETTASNTTIDSSDSRTIPPATPTQSSAGNTAEEVEVKDLVENFGKRLQFVSLQAPDAVQEIQEQYYEFVSPALLENWKNDVLKAPGRIVSSPWPDRIDIITLKKESPDRYVITGFIVEVTSVEVVNGGSATKIPVRIVMERGQGHWIITEYTEEQ